MPCTLCYLSNLAQKTRQISAHGLDLAQGLSAETRCFWQDSAWSQTMSPIPHIKAQRWNFSKDHQKPDKHILLSDSTKMNQFGSKGLPVFVVGLARTTRARCRPWDMEHGDGGLHECRNMQVSIGHDDNLWPDVLFTIYCNYWKLQHDHRSIITLGRKFNNQKHLL